MTAASRSLATALWQRASRAACSSAATPLHGTTLIDKTNTPSDVWADTAYRSAKNERRLVDSGLRSQIHRKKPQDKPMSEALARANGKRSKVRAHVKHVFAQQKDRMDLVIRTVGLARATVKIGPANLTTTQSAPSV